MVPGEGLYIHPFVVAVSLGQCRPLRLLLGATQRPLLGRVNALFFTAIIAATGSEEECLAAFRSVRDAIARQLSATDSKVR